MAKNKTIPILDIHGRTWGSVDALLDHDVGYYQSLQAAIVAELSRMTREELENTLSLIRDVRAKEYGPDSAF